MLKYFVQTRYGNTTPHSDYGKIVTMIYAVFGIPVYILYFQNIGKVEIREIGKLPLGKNNDSNVQVFANVFKWIYRKFHNWLERRKLRNKTSISVSMDYYKEEQEVLVPTTACILVLVLYIAIGKENADIIQSLI